MSTLHERPDDDTLDDDTHAQLTESLRRYREERYAFDARHVWLAAECGYSERAWRDYAAFGWLAVPLPAQYGGLDGDARAIGALMQYVGAALALEPVFASGVLCGRLLARAGADDALRSIASGERVFALAHVESSEDGAFGAISAAWRDGRVSGTKRLVLAGDTAATFIVTALDSQGALRVGAIAADAAGVSVQRYRLVDGRGAATVTLHDALAQPLAVAPADLDAVLDEGRLALAFEVLGAVRIVNGQTIEHLKTRRQFGRSLGANQVLQHRAVELYMLAQELRAVIATACRSPDPRTISAASAHAATTARMCAHEAVQMHGGMGITDALPVSHYFRRLMVCMRLLGDRAQLVRRFAALAAPGR